MMRAARLHPTVLFELLVPAVGLLGVVHASWAQQTADEYQLRKDQYDLREEGIKSDIRTNVTSDKIALVSALALTQVSLTATPPVLTLGLFSTAGTPLSVDVFNEQKRYYVTPVRDSWGPGYATFSWPTDIISRHGIMPGELYARAVHIDQGVRSLFPVCLYGGETPGRVLGYSFVVAPLQDMDLQWWILKVSSEEIVATGTPQAIKANQQFFIHWDCTSSADSTAEGEYMLKLNGTYKTRFGAVHTVPLSYQFLRKLEVSG